MDESPKTVNQLRTLEPSTKEFEANGRKYIVTERLSIERYTMFERLRIETGFTATFEEVFQVVKRTLARCEDIAQGKKVFAEMANDLYNTLKGLTDLNGKKPHAIWLCTLFIITEDEDVRYFDTEVMKRKIKDWEEAGIDSGFFIGLAIGTLADFQNAYSEATQIYLGSNPQVVPQ